MQHCISYFGMPHFISNFKFAGFDYQSFFVTLNDGDVNVPVTMYLLGLALKGKSINTLKNYSYKLQTFFSILDDSEMIWSEVDEEIMTRYLNAYLVQELRLSEKSLIVHVASLQGFYEWVYGVGMTDKRKDFSYTILDRGVYRSVQKSHKDVTKAYNSQYIDRKKFKSLLVNIKTNVGYLLARNELILMFAYDMGLRRAEIVDFNNLKVSDFKRIDEDELLKIPIIGKGKKLRYVPVPERLRVKISNFISMYQNKFNSVNLICTQKGEILEPNQVWRVFTEAKVRCQDAFFDTRVFHSLRHSYATNLAAWCYEHGLDPFVILPEYMGHSDKKTTIGYVAFEAMLHNRHQLLQRLHVDYSDIGGKPNK
jgi:site-specific recombinase XerD